MEFRLPRVVTAVAAVVCVVSFGIGVRVEQGPWASQHPYLINVLSSMTGFGAGIVFIGVVLDAIHRSHARAFTAPRRMRLVERCFVSGTVIRVSLADCLDASPSFAELITQAGRLTSGAGNEDDERLLRKLTLRTVRFAQGGVLLAASTVRDLSDTFGTPQLLAAADELETALVMRETSREILERVLSGEDSFSDSDSELHMRALFLHGSAQALVTYRRIANILIAHAPRRERADLLHWSQSRSEESGD